MHISTAFFTYNKESNQFISEVSNFGNDNFLHRIYPDACDEGLVLISEKTQQEATYYLDHIEYSNDEDHELQAWHLFPTSKTCQLYPKLKKSSIIIFND